MRVSAIYTLLMLIGAVGVKKLMYSKVADAAVHTLEPLCCNQQESLLNPHFIVCGQRDSRWEDVLKQTVSPS